MGNVHNKLSRGASFEVMVWNQVARVPRLILEHLGTNKKCLFGEVEL